MRDTGFLTKPLTSNVEENCFVIDKRSQYDPRRTKKVHIKIDGSNPCTSNEELCSDGLQCTTSTTTIPPQHSPQKSAKTPSNASVTKQGKKDIIDDLGNVSRSCFSVSVWCMWDVCWVVVGDVLAPGTPAVVDAVDGLAPLAVVTFSRRGAGLMLAPGTPAVQLAVDGLAPLFNTKG